MYPLIIVVALLLLIAIGGILKRKHSHWTRMGIAQIKPEFLFGNFKDPAFGKGVPNSVIVEAYRHFKRIGAKHGGIYVMYTPVWIPTDLGLIKQILFKDFSHFTEHGFFYQHKNDVLSNHLFNSEGSNWKRLRNKLSPTFSSGKLKSMFNILDSLGDRLESKLTELYQEGKPLNVKEITSCFGADVIANCAFGLECNSLENPDNDFMKYGRKVFEPRYFWELVEYFFSWNLLGSLGYTWQSKDVNKFFIDLVQDMINYRQKNNVTRQDFLQLLLELMHNDQADKNGALTFEDVAANVFLMFAAGFETTSTTTAFMLYELARHPLIQDKLRSEIWTVSKNDPNYHVTYDDLQKMKYCDMVIQETLRLHGVATEIPRKCTDNYKIPGTETIIPKGTHVLIPSWAIQNDPEFYPEPETFNPERFSKPHRELTYLPFGEGPRLCLGMRFAIVQIKLTMVKYLRRFKYQLNADTLPEISYEANNVTLIPKGTVLLDIYEVGHNTR